MFSFLGCLIIIATPACFDVELDSLLYCVILRIWYRAPQKAIYGENRPNTLGATTTDESVGAASRRIFLSITSSSRKAERRLRRPSAHV